MNLLHRIFFILGDDMARPQNGVSSLINGIKKMGQKVWWNESSGTIVDLWSQKEKLSTNMGEGAKFKSQIYN